MIGRDLPSPYRDLPCPGVTPPPGPCHSRRWSRERRSRSSSWPPSPPCGRWSAAVSCLTLPWPPTMVTSTGDWTYCCPPPTLRLAHGRSSVGIYRKLTTLSLARGKLTFSPKTILNGMLVNHVIQELNLLQFEQAFPCSKSMCLLLVRL